MHELPATHDWNDLYYFARVAEKGSFSGAARALQIPKSRLSRRVAELEQRLGVRLLQRTTRRLMLTDIGARFLLHCQAMLAEADAATALARQLQTAPRGRLRVSCPAAMAQDQLAAVLPAFLAAYPDIRLELLVVNRRVDLVEEGVDVALRVRPPGEEDALLATRRFLTSCSVCVAAPAALAQWPELLVPQDLVRVPTLGMARADWKLHWHFTRPGADAVALQLTPRLAADDFHVIRSAALAGLGVAVLPLAYCRAQLEAGALQRVLQPWQLPAGVMHAVYPSRRGLAPAVRAFLDFLAAALGAEEGAATNAAEEGPGHALTVMDSRSAQL